MRKIYDCFPFFNELDLLELRLREHNDYVDYFVIAEANKSHQGNPKPFYIEENWNRYREWHDKIIYVKIEDMPNDQYTWTLENFQRNAIERGLGGAQPDDVIVVSDCDEMLRGSTFNILRNDTQRKIWVCRQPIFWVKLNYLQTEPVGYNVNSMAMVRRYMTSPQDMRNKTWWGFTQLPLEHQDADSRVINHAGWHFSFLGDDNHVKTKLLNFAHDEARHLAEGFDSSKMIEQGKGVDMDAPTRFTPVLVDDYFPETVLNNLDKYKDLIIPAVRHIKDFLPVYGKN